MSNQDDNDPDDLYEELERRALFDLPEEESDDVDIVAELRGEENGREDATGDQDITLGGYIAKHDRVPAFEGSNGQPYTVDVDVEQLAAEDGPVWAAFLVFVRWAATGAGIMDHCESGDVARGATEEEARAAAMELTLYEIRGELDAAIERQQRALEE